MAATEFINASFYAAVNAKMYLRMEDNGTDTLGLHNCTMDNVLYSTDYGKFLKGVRFNGTNSTGTITDHADLKPTGVFSFGGWLATTEADGVTIFQSFSYPSKYAGIRLTLNSFGSNKLVLDSGKNTGGTQGTDFQIVSSTTSVNDGTRRLFVATWDGTYLNMFINNALEAQTAWANAPAYAATNYVRMGCGNNAGTNAAFYAGDMDDFFFCNGTALSLTQVKELYEGPTGGAKIIHFI